MVYSKVVSVIKLQVLAAVAVSMGSMIVGFSSAYTSPALASMEDSKDIEINEEQVNCKFIIMKLIRNQIEPV